MHVFTQTAHPLTVYCEPKQLFVYSFCVKITTMGKCEIRSLKMSSLILQQLRYSRCQSISFQSCVLNVSGGVYPFVYIWITDWALKLCPQRPDYEPMCYDI